jgi:hypothetical protein
MLMDLVLYEPLRDRISVVALSSTDESTPRTDEERELLRAMAGAHASLFILRERSPKSGTMRWEDRLNPLHPEIEITDLLMSHSAKPGTLFFSRVLTLSHFSMTSGVAMAFDGKLDAYLRMRAKALEKEVPSSSASVCRYAAYFRLNRLVGMPMAFQEI